MLKRKKQSLNQTEFAKLLYVSKSTVSNWENDVSEPKMDQFKLIDKVLECDLTDLIGESKSSKLLYKNEKEYSQNINYSPYHHNWNIYRNLFLALMVAFGISAILAYSDLWLTLSIFSAIVYIISVVVILLIDNKNQVPTINFPIGHTLIMIHTKEIKYIDSFYRNHRFSIILQLFIILFSFITLLGLSGEKMSSTEIVYLVVVFLVTMGWTIFIVAESFKRSYIQKKLNTL